MKGGKNVQPKIRIEPIIKLMGASVVEIDTTDNRFVLSPEAVEKALGRDPSDSCREGVFHSSEKHPLF